MTRPAGRGFPQSSILRVAADRSDNDTFLRKELWVGHRHDGGQVMATQTLRVLVFQELGKWTGDAAVRSAAELLVLNGMQLRSWHKCSADSRKLLVSFWVL